MEVKRMQFFKIRLLILIVFVLTTISVTQTTFAASIKKPEFIYQSKVVTKNTKLTIRTNENKGVIYYTTNGSEPIKGKKGTKTAKGKTKNLKIKKTTTVKARVYVGKKKSKVAKITIVYLKPAEITEIKNENDRIRITWKTDKYVNGYYIYRKGKDNKWKKYKKLNGKNQKTFLDTGVEINNKYSYMVIPYKGKKTASIKSKISAKSINLVHQHLEEIVLDGYYTVEKCSLCGVVNKKYLTEDIPEYWNQTIVNALTNVTAHKKIPSYIYITDTHWDTNAKNSPVIANFLSSQLNNTPVVFGGDVIYATASTRQKGIDETKDFLSKFTANVFSTTGNHDYNTTKNPKTSLTEDDLYNVLYKHESSFAHLDGKSLYSYMDDKNNKVRMISFCFTEYNVVPEDTIKWIEKRVTELPADWAVVLFSHAYWTFKEAGVPIYPRENAEKLMKRFLEIQKKSKATIALWQVGHVHRDYAAYVRNESDKDNTKILVVSTSCDNYSQSTRCGGPVMAKGTATEQLLEVVQIDTENRKIYMTRVGAGNSRSFAY